MSLEPRLRLRLRGKGSRGLEVEDVVQVPEAGQCGLGGPRPRSVLGSEPEKSGLTAKKETELGALSSALQRRRLW